jgi:hypothetical protein
MNKPVDKPRRTTLMGLLTVFLGSAIALFVAVVALALAGVDINRQAWLLKVAVFGPEPIGIFQADERFGWVNSPSATGRHRLVPDFDVEYHIDPLGHRLIPGEPPPAAPVAVFVGGSFTFGEGVADDEAYPAVLQREWPNIRVINTAVNGWGTTQAYLALERELEANDQILFVAYGFIGHHLRRNYLRKSWLEVLLDSEERRNPYYEIEGNRLVFKGLADPALNGLPEGPKLNRREALMTRILINIMAKRCAKRGIPFVVIYLPDGSQGRDIEMLSRSAGHESVIDLRPLFDFSELHFQHDIHLHPEGHRRVATALQPLLEARLPDAFR